MNQELARSPFTVNNIYFVFLRICFQQSKKIIYWLQGLYSSIFCVNDESM